VSKWIAALAAAGVLVACNGNQVPNPDPNATSRVLHKASVTPAPVATANCSAVPCLVNVAGGDTVYINPPTVVLTTPTPGPTATPTPVPTIRPTPVPTPTSTPTATPVPTSPPGNVWVYHGCQVFTSGDYFNADFSNAAVDQNSAHIIAGLPALTSSNFPGARYFQVNLASSSTSQVPFGWTHSYGYLYDILIDAGSTSNGTGGGTSPATVPWQSSFFMSPLNDHHAVVLDASACVEYDYYGSSFSGGTFFANGGHVWNLNEAISAQYAPAHHSDGADAADLPYMALMLTGEDATQPGPIQHAIGFYFPTGNGIDASDWVRPADSPTAVGSCSSAPCLAYGDHIRLHASYPCPTSPQANKICVALKTHGAYYYDQAGEFGFLFAAATDGSFPWNGADVGTLVGHVRITDFDVLQRGQLL
jgi:hypothetical protein